MIVVLKWFIFFFLFPFSRFVGHLLKLLVCNNEKFGTQIQKHVKELVGHEMSPLLYPILFDQIKVIVDKFFDQQGQVRASMNCCRREENFSLYDFSKDRY